ncbi:MAG: pyridoxamine kinase [Ruminiclostridium sp.]|nr:pyridoxamine kinase [Ruminiclostridium sp.]
MITDKQPICAAIHDMSGFGRCSLSVILPIISAMGIQCVAVPTAVLSTHTGGFDDFVFRGMTDFLSPCCGHYRSLGIGFDTIYSGFLASDEQVDCCLEFFDSFPKAKVVVDPVMGDDGELYRTYTPELVERMKELVGHADIITPNLTEAAILLGEPYRETFTEAQVRDMLERLCKMTDAAVMTGVCLDNGKHANICLDGKTGEYSAIYWEPVPSSYPGTGDIFSSVMTGRITLGDSFPEAVRKATEFVSHAIAVTVGNGQPFRNGVEFERVLGDLI